MSLAGEFRKVQRLGSSSLIITLPKSWVKLVGLKPGDTVYISIEGTALKVIPSTTIGGGGSADTVANISIKDYTDLGDLWRTLWCIYIMGSPSVELKMGSIDSKTVMLLKDLASRLVGLNILWSGGDSVRVDVMVDMSKFDVKTTIKTLVNDLISAIDLLEKSVRGENVVDEVMSVRNDAYRTQAIIERHLVSSYSASSRGSWENSSLLIAATMVGLLIADIVDMALFVSNNRIPPRDSDMLAGILGELRNLVAPLGGILSSPSRRRSREVMGRIGAVQNSLSDSLAKVESKEAAVIIGRFMDFLTMVKTIVNIAFCVASKDYIS